MEEKHSGTVFNLAQVINSLYTHEGSKGDNELVIKAAGQFIRVPD